MPKLHAATTSLTFHTTTVITIMSPKPHVEIAAVIPDSQGRIVIGKRKGKEGAGKLNELQLYLDGREAGPFSCADVSTEGLYELPGGNLDFGEDIFACVQRETLEETGLKIKGKKVIAYTNDIQKEENKHEVTLYVLCEREDSSQEPEVSIKPPFVIPPTRHRASQHRSWTLLTYRPAVAQGAPEVRGLGVEDVEGYCGHGRVSAFHSHAEPCAHRAGIRRQVRVRK